MSKFQYGSIVHLKSGSPSLTVVDYQPPKDQNEIGAETEQGSYTVVWFADGQINKAEVDADALISSHKYMEHVAHHAGLTGIHLTRFS